MIPDGLIRALREKQIPFCTETPLKALSTFRVGGVAELTVSPDSREGLREAVCLLGEYSVPFEVIGRGSNLLFCDGVLEGALLLTESLSRIELEGERLVAEAGVSLAALANRAAEASLTGLEFARGIPGTVGGALFMNAGAYGGSMADVTVESLALELSSGALRTVTEHSFGYRTGIYMTRGDLLCLGGTFRLTTGERAAIDEKMRELAVARREKQPLEYPSAGSYFKRPEGHFAGKLIEECGLKGYRVGGAAVSEKHAGFLINLGGATAADVLRLEEHVRSEVLRVFGVELEREVRYIR